ncbi:helix-turn-helix domain-containing protein [Actinoplanes sp. TBRC 11911]|uniref:helix-turn-helix domain-containing protein n=1 Tax=Actinoplanes sp. TBRC 11911 TaxID=2729386 RepID=UPI00145FBCBC|nr:helix-turn-helix transcriptional regulator [Actinoplanes sp. TBRC 11911]NMO56779.1 helix-turn-helix domain-containing protein [Actinoplanes sp. TBRC 11911]
MNQQRSPTIRRRRLGAEMRRHREAAGVTIDTVAARIGCSMSKVSRIETGHTSATPADVQNILDIYGVDDAIKMELVQIAREARQKGWWHPFSTVLTGAYVGLEAAARAVRTYEQQVIPGLLQSEEYAIAMIRAARLGDRIEEIEQRVHVRMARQSLLTSDDPIDLRVVLDEAVLSRPVGGDEVMRDQLRRLIEAARLPNVTLQILPFDVGAHAGMDGTFAILEFEEERDADVVFTENATGGLFLEKFEELEKYNAIFEAIQATALDPDASTQMMELLVEEPLWKLKRRVSEST